MPLLKVFFIVMIVHSNVTAYPITRYTTFAGEDAEYITFNMMGFQALIELMGDALYFYSHRK